ncbi:MAG: hypothetical protein U9N04_01140 [Patescibacteria group bacterium]|nr:hypothetical protein [Patescibacteria group bacterium]
MAECNHEWKVIKEREEWDEGNAHYTVVKARQCKECGKYEILDGNVVVSGGGEYMLEDGSWGLGISI